MYIQNKTVFLILKKLSEGTFSCVVAHFRKQYKCHYFYYFMEHYTMAHVEFPHCAFGHIYKQQK